MIGTSLRTRLVASTLPLAFLAAAAVSGAGNASHELTSERLGVMPSRTLDFDPVEYYLQRRTAGRAFASGEYAGAAALFARLTRLYPDDGDHWLLLAHCRAQLRDWPGAISAYRQALVLGAFPVDLTDDVNPNDTMVHLARAYARSGESDLALAWLQRAVATRYDDRPGLVDDDAFAALRHEARFRVLATGAAEIPESRVAGWRLDLRFLRSEIDRLHPQSAHSQEREALDQAFAATTAKVARLDDHQMSAEIARLIGMVGNGHNLLLPFESDHGGLPQLPLKLFVFSDGVYVTDAAPGHTELIGARLDRIGDTPTHAALAALEPFVARDNNTQLDFFGALWLTTPHLLQAAGILPDIAGLRLTLTMPDGAIRVVDDLPLRPFAVETHALRSRDPRPATALYLSDFDRTLWRRELPEQRAIYVHMSDVQPCCGTSIREFAEATRRAADRMGAERLILDLRNNAGGNGYLVPPIVKLAAYFDASRGTDSVFVIFGRNTLSAAHALMVEIDRITDAVMVGEASGSSPNAYAENGWFRLPYSGLRGFISSQLHQTSWPEDHRVWVSPHLPVALSAADYFAGHDPALTAIFGLTGSQPPSSAAPAEHGTLD